jgi:ataxia telangiectasia mutated family protein
MHVANAAQQCDLSYICLYYIEIWYNEQLKSTNYNLNINNIFKNEPNLIDLLINSYKMIGEYEAISENLLFLNSILNKKINSCNETTEFSLLFNYDNRLFTNINNTNEDQYNLVSSLKNCGLNYLLSTFLTSTINNTDIDTKLNDLKYTCALKLKNWDLETDFNNEIDLTIDKLFYQTINTFINETNNKNKFNRLYSKTQNFLLNNLVKTNNSNLQTTIINLYNLEQINHSFDINAENYENLNESLFNCESNDFCLVDSINANRILILKSFIGKSDDIIKNKLTNSIVRLYESLIDNTIIHKRFQIGVLYVNEMKMLNLSENFNLIINYKHCLLLYEKCEFTNAKLLIKHTIDLADLNSFSSTDVFIEYYIKCLNLYAVILDKIKCESPNKIIENYLEVSIDLINKYKLKNKSIETNSYFKLAKFTDLQLQQINNFIKSTTFEQKQDLLKKFKLESKEIEKLEPDSKLYIILRKQLDIDEKEFKLLNQDKELYLCKSIENYLNCLEFGNDYDIHMFRLISLWTQNHSNVKVNKIIKKRIFKIHSYKFIPLMYQLAARMKISNEDLFYEILIELILNTAQDHPYHVLPIIFALSNAYKDENYISGEVVGKTSKTKTKKQQSLDDTIAIGVERLNAARLLIDKLKVKHFELMKSISYLFDAYIELANFNIEQHKKSIRQQIPIPKMLMINQIKNYKNIPVLTNELPVSLDADYSSIISIAKFESTFSLAGGINLPKIITCLGSDGVLRKQLVKSRDDTRQGLLINTKNNNQNKFYKFFFSRCYYAANVWNGQ